MSSRPVSTTRAATIPVCSDCGMDAPGGHLICTCPGGDVEEVDPEAIDDVDADESEDAEAFTRFRVAASDSGTSSDVEKPEAPAPAETSDWREEDRRKRLLRFVGELEPARYNDLKARVGGGTERFRRALTALVDSGAIERAGEGIRTRYYLRGNAPKAPALTAQQLGGETEASAGDCARLIALIAEHEPVGYNTLRQLFPGATDTFNRTLRALLDAGGIQKTGRTRAARYHLTETLDRQTAAQADDPPVTARRDILRTVHSEAGKWTEERIAATGAFTREQVAFACAQLLAQGEIAMNPDGTYSPCPTA